MHHPDERRLVRASYHELKELYKRSTEQYVAALNDLLNELNHRRVPWDMAFRREIAHQVARVEKDTTDVLGRLP